MTSSSRKNSQKIVVTISLLGIIILGTTIAVEINFYKALLFLIGTALGITLMHALFGFSGGWRNFIRNRNSQAIRAQILLLALTSLLFFPLLAQLIPGFKPGGTYGPVSTSVFIGAFIFGIGMQLGGGCGSGTLFTVGQGQADMLLVLIFFIIGATLGAAHLSWWSNNLPGTSAISLIKVMGWVPALLSQLATLAVLYFLVRWMDHRRNPSGHEVASIGQSGFTRVLQGPWPLWWAVILLAILNLLTLLIAKHPWSITFAFGLWGSKIYAAMGGDPASWSYWHDSRFLLGNNPLKHTVLADTTSIMNFGIILGAILAAALAGKYAPENRYQWKRIITAIIGGLLLGYGARLAYGCNIGALLGGVASGSVHGWLWLVAAFTGGIAGVKLRVWFGLDKPVANP